VHVCGSDSCRCNDPSSTHFASKSGWEFDNVNAGVHGVVAASELLVELYMSLQTDDYE